MKKSGKNNIVNIFFILVLLVGLSLLLYPSVSDYWNSFRQSRAIIDYAENVSAIDAEVYDEMWKNAKSYNESLLERSNEYFLNDVQKAEYEDILTISDDTSVMGYIEIPDINCLLPIYHGTEESVLQIGIGHLEWTSLPVGGENTHCVLSGHRGLPSAKLFTDLDQIFEGDIFILRVLDEVLTYEVDQILIVEPHETEALKIVEGEDFCTLVTCTPYGINSHRLLVRGHRTENLAESKTIYVTADAVPIEPVIVASMLAVPMLLLLLILLFASDSKKKRRKKFEKNYGGNNSGEVL